MVPIDGSNNEIVYKFFQVDGREAEALSESYFKLFEIVGRDAMLNLFNHYHGDKINCPMRLYRPEFIVWGYL